MGRKNLFLVAIALFLTGSAPGGTADSMTQLIIYRFIQGLVARLHDLPSQAITGDLHPFACVHLHGPHGSHVRHASILGPIGGWLDPVSWR